MEKTESNNELFRIFDEADERVKCVLALMTFNMRRDDVLFAALEALGRRKPSSIDEEDIGEPDYDLLRALCTICHDAETHWWGRALVLAYMDGDRGRKDAILSLIQRRISN